MPSTSPGHTASPLPVRSDYNPYWTKEFPGLAHFSFTVDEIVWIKDPEQACAPHIILHTS